MPKLNISESRYISRTRESIRSGFSLIELIIVILIASLFAALVFNNINLSTKKAKKLGIYELKETRHIDGAGELICIDKCAHCAMKSGSKPIKIDSKLKELSAYILDDGDNPQKIDFGRIKDKKICLRFRYYPNGSTSEMILQSGDKYYFIPSYFGEIEEFDDMDEAVARWTRYKDQIDTVGAYY